jgi:hypothetical protein
MRNYRPVSVLTFFFSKILEKLRRGRLSQQLCTNGILVPEQFGFRKGISTENFTNKLAGSAFKFLKQKWHVGGISCDLANVCGC